jgi:hypothetical protein
VCGYCHSAVLREGDKLSRLGKMAELFDDHSPLRLLASGSFGKNAFTLVGRLQYKYDEGTWSEWHALLDDGSTAWLSEDNGSYVFMRPTSLSREVPAQENFRTGLKTSINGKPFSVASNESVALIAAQGELPHLPALGTPFVMVELRNDTGEVLSIDYGPSLEGRAPMLTLGRAVTLDELKLSGLADESVKDEHGRQFNCPNCGAPVTVALASSKSITCGSCNSIIDLSQGAGAQLAHAIQDEPIASLIALGSIGQLQGAPWQVVGFQHRMGHEPGDDEHFGWSEYLLYNQKRGFNFLVDSSEGWSLVKPVTGAPSLSADRQSATYLGTTYRLKETYDSQTTYVAGEFYWQVRRGQNTSNRDYAAGQRLLCMEESANEITWSAGSQIDSDSVAKAFKLDDKQALFKRTDVGPFSAAPSLGARTILLIVVGGLLLVLLSRCSSNCDPRVENCSSSGGSYRSSGGSWGGSSSGGGHK